jgi:hypothetical protein
MAGAPKPVIKPAQPPSNSVTGITAILFPSGWMLYFDGRFVYTLVVLISHENVSWSLSLHENY